MTSPSPWEKLRRIPVVRVLVVYLGACWAVLQIIDVLMGMLSLPRWVGPVSVVLLLVGLVVILATAWVQSLPSTTEREVAGEVPTDWQIAPGDVVASLKRGRLPHLTWGRAVLGGIFALSLLIGGSGAYVLIRGGEGILGPQPLAAGEAAAGVAVVPFAVQGSDLEVWREGMVDLLATNLDGLGGFRAIDARTVLSRWHATVADKETTDLREALRVAGATDARYAVVGSAVSLGGQVRLTADVYDIADGSKLGQARAEGEPGAVLALADKLAIDVTRILLGTSGQSLVSESQVQSLATSSLEALRSYLAGERLYRQGEFERAASAYEEAVAQDSAFASAYYRLTQAYGWMEAGGDAVERAELALRGLRENLPPRDRLLLEGEEGLSRGDPAVTLEMEEVVKRYPDDPDAWVLLGEFYVHLGTRVLRTDEDVRRVHAAAAELDPTFAPTYIHYAENAMHRGQPEEARRLIDTYLSQAPVNHQGIALGLGYDLQFGDEAARTAALAALDTLTPHTASDLTNGLARTPAGMDALIDVSDALWRRSRSQFWGVRSVLARVGRGRLADAESRVRELDAGSGTARYARYVLGAFAGTTPPAAPGGAQSCADGEDPACLLVTGAWSVDAGDDAGASDAQSALRGARAAAGDEEGREAYDAFVRALDAYRAWKSGDGDGALEVLTDTQMSPAMWGEPAALVRLWMAGILSEQRRTEDAVRFLESLRYDPGLATLALALEGRVQAQAGNIPASRSAWQAFLDLWSEAPADHPLIIEARAAVAG